MRKRWSRRQSAFANLASEGGLRCCVDAVSDLWGKSRPNRWHQEKLGRRIQPVSVSWRLRARESGRVYPTNWE